MLSYRTNELSLKFWVIWHTEIRTRLSCHWLSLLRIDIKVCLHFLMVDKNWIFEPNDTRICRCFCAEIKPRDDWNQCFGSTLPLFSCAKKMINKIMNFSKLKIQISQSPWYNLLFTTINTKWPFLWLWHFDALNLIIRFFVYSQGFTGWITNEPVLEKLICLFN